MGNFGFNNGFNIMFQYLVKYWANIVFNIGFNIELKIVLKIWLNIGFIKGFNIGSEKESDLVKRNNFSYMKRGNLKII